MSSPAALLTPPRVTRAWYVACQSHELREAPLARSIWGQPLVLFRDAAGQAAALLDRCPHRNLPLSAGEVVEGTLRCSYHGWRFGSGGQCAHIPAFTGDPSRQAYAATAYPVQEQQGFVWVWADLEHPPEREPYAFPYDGREGYLIVKREVRAEATLHAVAENALDVPHTAFLHAGLFRQDRDRAAIRCVVERHHDRVQCEYIGERRPEGLAGRLLSPSGGLVVHFDRFILPSIVEVEYRIGDENHIVLSGAMTPVNDYDTRLYAVVAVRSRIPGWLLRPLVQPVALRIFGQDARILAQQSEALHRFGEARFVSTEIDLLGPHILKLLQRAEMGDLGDPQRAASRREVTMMI